jgi:hypothetical protein
MRAAVLNPRLRVAAVLLLALIVAGQLTLHQHSLIPESGGTAPLACSICAFDADRTSLDTPLFGDALEFLGIVVSETEPFAATVSLLTSSVRGPPAPAC